MTTRKEFTIALADLRSLLIEMSERTEEALNGAIQALLHQDADAAKQIMESDHEINRLEDRIIDLGSRLVATQQPVAKDWRRILVAIKVSSDLERMADLAADIAEAVVRLDGHQLIKPLIDIPRMAEMAKAMIRDSAQAYVNENVELAYQMARNDDLVDQLYSEILKELFAYSFDSPKAIQQAMLLSFIGRYIERIADHATNIGEMVVYLVHGKRPDLND